METAVIIIYHPDEQVSTAIGDALIGGPYSGIYGKFDSSADFRQAVLNQVPDAVIVRFGDRVDEEIETARYLRRHIPSLAVIFTVNQLDNARLLSAMKAGAAACIPEQADPETWRSECGAAMAGEWPITNDLRRQEMAALVLGEFEAPSRLRDLQNDILANLLPAETELLLGIAAGNAVPQSEDDYELMMRRLRSILFKLISNTDIAALLEEYTRLTTS